MKNRFFTTSAGTISTCTINGKIHSVGSGGVRAQGTPRAARLQQLSPGGPATLSNGIHPRFQCLDLSSWLWQNVPMKCFFQANELTRPRMQISVSETLLQVAAGKAT